MYEWERQIQTIVDEIGECIKNRDDEALALAALARRLGYSEFHASRKFREVAGMPLRDYLRRRKLAFALKEVRDTDRSMLAIALDHGFSSHEAFTRAFKATYGLTPSAFRMRPRPVVLRTKLSSFDRYLFGLGEIGMEKSTDGVQTYFVRLPAHKFLHVKNYESNGYWDFWQKQNAIPGQDYDTVCGLLDSIKGKLDDDGGSEVNSGSGQLMAYIWDSEGRLCDWGIPRTECYGVRLPADWQGWQTCPRPSTWCSSTARSTTSRRTAPWRRRSSGPWPRSTSKAPATATTTSRGAFSTSISIRAASGSMSVPCGGAKSRFGGRSGRAGRRFAMRAGGALGLEDGQCCHKIVDLRGVARG